MKKSKESEAVGGSAPLANTQVNIIETVVNYAKDKGRSLIDLATKAKAEAIAKATNSNPKEVEAVIKAAQKVAEKNPAPAAKKLNELSEKGFATLAEAIKANTNGGAKPETSKADKPMERASIIDLSPLPRDKKQVEVERIALRLLRADARQENPRWPSAHMSDDEGGQNYRFRKATSRILDEMEKNNVKTTQDLEKETTVAFTRIQGAIEREAKAGVAEATFNSYLKSIGFTVAKGTDPDKGTVSKEDASDAVDLMQRKSFVPSDALSVVTDMDWPASPTSNGTSVPAPATEDDAFSEPAVVEDDGFES